MCIYVCLDVVCQNGGWILKDREIYVFKMRMPPRITGIRNFFQLLYNFESTGENFSYNT